MRELVHELEEHLDEAEEFVGDVPWAHLDIAGPAFAEKDLPHAPRGGTGFGVRLLVRYLQDVAA